MKTVSSGQLRAEFARRLSVMYGAEVPAYRLLVEACEQINQSVIAADSWQAQQLGSAARVTAERHGAIRVGSPAELAEVARIFAAMGMYPVGYYDLRDAAASAVPVVSTAFRPVDAAELAANPFRVFTSLLAVDDERFFDADLRARLKRFLSERRLFGAEVLCLADRAVADGGLPTPAAGRFVELAAACFALSGEPVDRAWYTELETVSPVAADIGGVRSTHVNHLTPRVLDIDALYATMIGRGVEMIEEIQGPPRWAGPDMLLRQTSFRALAESRMFREPDGLVVPGSLRVRFGEVEARGMALTRSGRERHEQLTAQVDRLMAADPAAVRATVAAKVWAAGFPASARELWSQGLGVFTVQETPEAQHRPLAGSDVADWLDAGLADLKPVVYEDFLPRSAAGIFQSNLVSAGRKSADRDGAALGADWLAGVLERELLDPDECYRAESEAALDAARARLGL